MLGDFPLGVEPLGAEPSLDADLVSAFNFCNPFDIVLPPPAGGVSTLDMQHLWGLSTSVVTTGAVISGLDASKQNGPFLKNVGRFI